MLASAVEELDPWPDGAVLAEAIALLDRLDAKVMAVFGDSAPRAGGASRVPHRVPPGCAATAG